MAVSGGRRVGGGWEGVRGPVISSLGGGPGRGEGRVVEMASVTVQDYSA